MNVCYSRLRVLCATLIALPLPVHAATMIQRGPVDAPSSVQTLSGSGPMSWNLDEIPYVSEGGVTLMTKVTADDSTGVIRVYAESDTRGVSGIPDTQIALARGQVSANGIVVGSGSEPVQVGFRFAFDGSFLTHAGNSFHQLGANITVALPSATVPFTNVTHQVSMDLRTDLLDDQAIDVQGSSEVSYFEPGFKHVTQPYAGGSYTALTTTMDQVAGVLQLDMLLHPGQTFAFVGSMFAQSYSEPLIPVSGPLDYSQSAGAVDGFSTGTLGILLPAGYSFEGDAGMLTNAVVAVPEPQTYALFGAGLVTLIAALRRRGSKGQARLPRGSRASG